MGAQYHLIKTLLRTYISGQLRYFDFILQLAFKTGIQDFPLRWFQAINDIWYASNIVGVTEVNKLSIVF